MLSGTDPLHGFFTEARSTDPAAGRILQGSPTEQFGHAALVWILANPPQRCPSAICP